MEDAPSVVDGGSEPHGEGEGLAIDLRSLDLGGDVVIVTDRDGVIIHVNDAFVETTGFSRQEAIGSTPRLLSSGYQDEAFYDELWTTVLGGEVWQGEMIDRRRDGSLRTYYATISPVKDNAGRTTHIVAIERDVMDELTRATPLGSSGLVHTDLEGGCVFADPRAAELLQARPSELLGTGLLGSLEPEDAAEFREVVSETVERGRGYRLDVRPRGSDVWLHVEVRPLTMPTVGIVGAAASLEDRSEQMAVDRELGRRGALLQGVLNSLPEPVAVVDDDGTVLAVNRAWRQTRRTDPRDVVLRARVGDDLLVHVGRAAEEGDSAAVDLLTQIEWLRTTGSEDAGGQPPAARDFVVTPLEWNEGGFVLRRAAAPADDPGRQDR